VLANGFRLVVFNLPKGLVLESSSHPFTFHHTCLPSSPTRGTVHAQPGILNKTRAREVHPFQVPSQRIAPTRNLLSPKPGLLAIQQRILSRFWALSWSAVLILLSSLCIDSLLRSNTVGRSRYAERYSLPSQQSQTFLR